MLTFFNSMKRKMWAHDIFKEAFWKEKMFHHIKIKIRLNSIKEIQNKEVQTLTISMNIFL